MANLNRANHHAGADSVIETFETPVIRINPRTDDSPSTCDHKPAAARLARAMSPGSGSSP